MFITYLKMISKKCQLTHIIFLSMIINASSHNWLDTVCDEGGVLPHYIRPDNIHWSWHCRLSHKVSKIGCVRRSSLIGGPHYDFWRGFGHLCLSLLNQRFFKNNMGWIVGCMRYNYEKKSWIGNLLGVKSMNLSNYLVE